MASYRLTDTEITAINRASDMYIEAQSNYTRLAPIVTIPPAYESEWYTLTKFEKPKGSMDGRDWVEVATASTKANASLIVYKYKFVIPRIEVESARRNGRPIWSENIQVAAKQMDQTLAHLIMEGTFADDPVAINGLRDGGTNVDGTGGVYNGALWNSATSAWIHAAAAVLAIRTAGFEGPFSWILSWNLFSGLATKYGAGDPPQKELIQSGLDINEFIHLGIGTSTTTTIYPMAAASTDDGCWYLVKKDPSVYRLAQTGPPALYLNPELNRDIEGYEGYYLWHGTMQIVQATGIQFNVDVDLV